MRKQEIAEMGCAHSQEEHGGQQPKNHQGNVPEFRLLGCLLYLLNIFYCFRLFVYFVWQVLDWRKMHRPMVVRGNKKKGTKIAARTKVGLIPFPCILYFISVSRFTNVFYMPADVEPVDPLESSARKEGGEQHLLFLFLWLAHCMPTLRLLQTCWPRKRRSKMWKSFLPY